MFEDVTIPAISEWIRADKKLQGSLGLNFDMYWTCGNDTTLFCKGGRKKCK